MNITKKDVLNVANLAMLDVTDAQANTLTEEMSGLIDLVSILNELDLDGVQPTNHIVPNVNVFRDDVVTNDNRRDELLKLAPQSVAGCFAVPKILE